MSTDSSHHNPLDTAEEKPSNIRVRTIFVDRKCAKTLLSEEMRHPKQRRLNKKTVDNIAKSMRLGRWREEANAIRIDTNNHLLDGQHRLQGFLASGLERMAFRIEVGHDPKSFAYIDTGKAKRTGDIVSYEKYHNPQKMMAYFKMNQRIYKGRQPVKEDPEDFYYAADTHGESLLWLLHAVDKVPAKSKLKYMPVLLAIVYLHKLNPSAAEQFLYDYLINDNMDVTTNGGQVREAVYDIPQSILGDCSTAPGKEIAYHKIAIRAVRRQFLGEPATKNVAVRHADKTGKVNSAVLYQWQGLENNFSVNWMPTEDEEKGVDTSSEAA